MLFVVCCFSVFLPAVIVLFVVVVLCCSAFGRSALSVVVCLLFCLIYLCCVAYLILIRDLICPIVELATGITLSHN